MCSLTRFFAAGMLAVSAFAANAATIAYGEAFDTLYQIDLNARQATRVGVAGMYAGQTIGNISGLTTSVDGSLYAIAGATKFLLKIDPAGGLAEVIGDLGLRGSGSGQFDALDLGMTADCDGNLWMSSGVLKQLWKVDAKNGATTLIGSTGHPIAGLVYRAGTLYGSGSRDDHGFYRVDQRTGIAALIGTFGPSAPSELNSVSMSFDDQGVLWAVLNYVPPNTGSVTPDWSDLARIDPATGAMTVLGPITGPESLRQAGMKGFTLTPSQCASVAASAAATPVGSPWALTLLGGLLAAAGLYSARQRLRIRA
ncbi:MAG: hypothetical protein ABIO49_06965 [Dokdonella sp.]